MSSSYTEAGSLWVSSFSSAKSRTQLNINISGNNLQMGTLARTLTDLYAATVVCISYRLAPEFPWPYAHHDGWDSLVWIAANAKSLGADTTAGFVVGGASAGGNIAAVIAQKSVSNEKVEGNEKGEEKLAAPLTGLWTDVAMLFARPENVPSRYRPYYLSQNRTPTPPVFSPHRRSNSSATRSKPMVSRLISRP